MKVFYIILSIVVITFFFPKKYTPHFSEHIDDRTSPMYEFKSTCLGIEAKDLCFGWVKVDIIR